MDPGRPGCPLLTPAPLTAQPKVQGDPIPTLPVEEDRYRSIDHTPEIDPLLRPEGEDSVEDPKGSTVLR